MARLGAPVRVGAALLDAVDRSGLRGRGGAAFPAGRKWRAVAERARGHAAVIANGAEGEPLSWKDRVLMETRPHLVIDGALLAADAVGASSVVLYVGAEHDRALAAMGRALSERPAGAERARILAAPVRYVSGEESAAVHFVNAGVAVPASTPPRPYERGVGGRPTLVHNVETLARVALIARADGAEPGPAAVHLLTITGVSRPGVIELDCDATVQNAIDAAGGAEGEPESVLIGGYFGAFVTAAIASTLPLSAEALRGAGLSLGCGVVAVQPRSRCGVAEVARIAAYLAGESARQCGPCVFGLGAIAAALGRVAAGGARPDDMPRLRRWSGELPGRGACRHPDGAAGLVASALRTFAGDFALHQRGRCGVPPARVAA